MSHLVRLDVANCGLRSLLEIESLVHLTHLDVGRNCLTRLTELRGLRCLRHVHVEENTLQRTCVDTLGTLSRMEMLDMRSVDARNIHKLNGLTRLERLYLGGWQVVECARADAVGGGACVVEHVGDEAVCEGYARDVPVIRLHGIGVAETGTVLSNKMWSEYHTWF